MQLSLTFSIAKRTSSLKARIVMPTTRIARGSVLVTTTDELYKRTALQRHFMSSSSPDAKSVLNMINAKIKRLYLVIRRESLNSLCESLGSRTPNTKLWKLVKNIHRVWPQVEKTIPLAILRLFVL
ncbi:hypothetical protein TNCT_566901 [Trichonephila clavata]|uniref:Uncharacterized protein n=1 Tax=Trichonephila clavata TaxID=2740835 RepID=A0A8X6IMI9_TRICU|nr:hypothetical protein TNCT_566901 [Trichonephila clavata]